MNTRSTFILLAVLAVVGMVAIYVKYLPERDKTSKAEPKVLDVNSADITKLVITPAEGQRVIFERKESDWRIVEPINATARTSATSPRRWRA
jgi:hypothetical protein